jgi:hypothetical protein
MTDARDDRILCKGETSVKHVDAALVHHQREFHWVTDFNVQASFFGFFNNSAGAVKPRTST